MKNLKGFYLLFKNIKAVIFDLDGLLIQSEEAWIKSETELLRSYGIKWPTQEIRQITSEFLPGRGQDEAAQFYKERFNVQDSIKRIREKRIRIVKDHYKKASLTEGSFPLLKLVKKSILKTSLASSAPMELIKVVLKNREIEKFFDNIISDDQIEKGKPEPDIFLLASKKLGVKPRDCLVFEDTENGLKAAKKARMFCVLVPNSRLPLPSQKVQNQANFVLQSLKDIDEEKLKQALENLK